MANWVNAAYSVDVSELCGHFLHFTQEHVRRLNKLVRYAHRLAGEPLVLHPLRGEVEVIVYGDAAFQNMNKSRSQGGAVAMLRDQETGTVAMISHYSRRVKRVARSTFAAELLNQATSYDLGVFVRRLMEWMWGVPTRLHARTDCDSLCKYVHSLRTHPREKTLNAEIDSLREALLEGTLTSFEHVPGRFNVADGLTRLDKAPKGLLLAAMRGRLCVPRTDTVVTMHFRPPPEC